MPDSRPIWGTELPNRSTGGLPAPVVAFAFHFSIYQSRAAWPGHSLSTFRSGIHESKFTMGRGGGRPRHGTRLLLRRACRVGTGPPNRIAANLASRDACHRRSGLWHGRSRPMLMASVHATAAL